MFYHTTTQINGHCCSVPVTLCLVLLQFLPFRFRIANRLCGNKIQCPSNHKVVVPFLGCSLYIPDPTNLTRPQGIQSKLLLLLCIPIKATAIPASIYYRYVFVDCRRIVPGRLVGWFVVATESTWNEEAPPLLSLCRWTRSVLWTTSVCKWWQNICICPPWILDGPLFLFLRHHFFFSLLVSLAGVHSGEVSVHHPP